ncbi:MAG TPA: helix-turn-helix domain-containing protein [Candidatus Gracilibacteria bacterium]|nr:helix-turn-helix domain-containing protein [Candidatus Gracilibacteria bacterium]
MLNRLFENLGLTGKEAKIYLAALELGSNPVSAIASKAKLNRVTTYDILEKLIKRGMVSSIIKRKIKFFTAVDPELLLTEFKKRTGELEKALPDLKRLYGETVHPKVRYFEGIEGIKSIYAETLTSKTEILNYCNSKEIREFWAQYDQEYVQERVQKNISLRGIAPDDEYGRRVHAEDNAMNREIRLVPKDKYNFTNEIHIFEDKVAIISFKDELIGMIIECGEISKTQRAIFEMVWNFATEPVRIPEMNIRRVGGIKKKEDEKEAQPESQVSLFM